FHEILSRSLSNSNSKPYPEKKDVVLRCNPDSEGTSISGKLTFMPGGKVTKVKHALIGLFVSFGLLSMLGLAQEKTPTPYFVVYDHYMEELDALEIGTSPVLGRAHGINTFLGVLTEFEYGARKWWTTELYIDWQHTRHEGSLFTGFRFENRFRP